MPTIGYSELEDIRLIDIRSLGLEDTQVPDHRMYSMPIDRDVRPLIQSNLTSDSETNGRERNSNVDSLKVWEHSCKVITNLTFLALPTFFPPLSLSAAMFANPDIVVDTFVETLLIAASLSARNEEELQQVERITRLKEKELLLAETLSLVFRQHGISDNEMNELSTYRHVLDVAREVEKQWKLYKQIRQFEPAPLIQKILREHVNKLCESDTYRKTNPDKGRTKGSLPDKGYQFNSDHFKEEREWIEKQIRNIEFMKIINTEIKIEDRQKLMIHRTTLPTAAKLERTQQESLLSHESFGEPIIGDFNDFTSSGETMIA